MQSDMQALDELVAARGTALKRYATFLCGDSDASDDLVQEALVRVLARRRTATVEQLEAYIKQIILNLVVDSGRRRRRWQRRLPVVAPAPVEDMALAACTRMTVIEALARLPARQRACVVLHYYEDLPVATIAHQLSCSEGTVKSQLHDARRALAQAWLDDDAADQEPGGMRA